MVTKVWRGTVIHATDNDPLIIHQNALIGVQDTKILFLEDWDKVDDLVDRFGFSKEEIANLGENEFLMPGMIDTHIHASQYAFTGTNLDLPLLEWLQKYTFPSEARYQHLPYARNAYKKVVRRVMKNGTTTACYFGTIHLPSTLELCDIVEEYGQRAYVGKVNMDRNSPDFYMEDTKQSWHDTERFIQAVQQRENDLVTPVVTPRFALSCTTQLMQQLGRLAKDYNVPIQSHISETRPECQAIRQEFPNHKHYADVYHKYGLLTDKTVMAHGVYLSDEELDLFQSVGAGIGHCPNSNLSLRSGIMNVRKIQKHNVKLGLGTDVAGGYHPSMLDSMRHAIQASNFLHIQESLNGDKAVSFKEVFRLATLGGSKVLGLDDKIGNFEIGKDFDALRINVATEGSPIDVFPHDSIDDVIQKFFCLGDDRNIQEVYVAGKKSVVSSQTADSI